MRHLYKEFTMTEKTKKLFWKAWGVSAGASAVVFAAMGTAGYVDALRIFSALLGLGFAAAGLWCLAKAFSAAPDASEVTKWYLLHAACVFLPVLFCMLVSFPDALGVLIPQLFPVPALAVLLALQKK